MALALDSTQHPHRRFNPLTQQWIICSPHRAQRPWQGQTEAVSEAGLVAYDPGCYLCPGNVRASGVVTPRYGSTHVFENDFAAVNDLEVVHQPGGDPLKSLLHRLEPVQGKCFVVCFHPRHDLTMAELEPAEILPVIKTWIELYERIPREYPFVRYVKIFENKGAMMGCSNPHPHGQVWALSCVPTISATVLKSQEDFANSNPGSMPDSVRLPDGRPSLLLAYAHSELYPEPSARVLRRTAFFVALVPFWAVWPFEVMILPHSAHFPTLTHLSSDAQIDLARILSHVTRSYDNLFGCSFPYSMAVNQAAPGGESSAAQLHLTFCPPLLRSATVRKFLVGFELFGEAQRDLTPESAADRLRESAQRPYYKSAGKSG